ncbi:Aminodeoxychorismate lyase [Lecanora helva]
MADTFQIITALRYDQLLAECPARDPGVPIDLNSSQLYMLQRHHYRMLAAIKDFNWPENCKDSVAALEGHIRAYLESKKGEFDPQEPLKIRAALSWTGTMDITSTKIAPVSPKCLFPRSLSSIVKSGMTFGDGDSPPTFRLVFSTVPITYNLFTKHKTTRRESYDHARSQTLASIEQSSGESDSLLPIEVLLYNQFGQMMEGTITTPYFFRRGDWVTPLPECGGNVGTTRQYALDHSLCKEGIVEIGSIQRGEKVALSNGVRGFGWGIVEMI